jgi:murein tripeptide amidase MpaA
MQMPDHVPVRLARIAAPLLIATALVLPAAVPVVAAEPDWPASNSQYHNWPELVAEIEQAAVDYPSIVSLFSIGKSARGLDIWMAKVSDNVAEDEAEPEVLVDALHHAREHLTTEQALALLGWLTRDYGADETVTRLVDTREVFIIFALNPDGMRYDLTGTPYRAWRKNLQRDAAGSAMYTDLNRNYGYRWGCCGGSSGKRSANTYRGPAAFSAPETRALRDFVNGRVVNGVQQIRTHVTLHTNGQLILWPYGYTKTNIPSDMSALDHTALVALGRAMAARNGYVAKQSSDLYVTDGDQIDWMYGRHRIFSYTYELFPTEKATVWGDHYPDDSFIAPQTERNRKALLHLIDRAACPYADLGSRYAAANCGPLFDDLEINRGWVRNAAGTDTATSGRWAVANPQPTSSGGAKQLGRTVSGIRALVTGAAAGASAGANDVDGGTTTIRSRVIRLPEDPAAFGNLTFSWTFAHSAGSSAKDALRVLVEAEDGSQTVVFEVLGRPVNVSGAWRTASVPLAAWAGQPIRLVMAATDGGKGNLVEAAIDDVRIRRP